MKNAKDRRNNSLLEPDWFDGQMLWVMLRHLRADRRHRVSRMRSQKDLSIFYLFRVHCSQKTNLRAIFGASFKCIKVIMLQERAAARDGGDTNPREDTDSVSEDEDNQGIK